MKISTGDPMRDQIELLRDSNGQLRLSREIAWDRLEVLSDAVRSVLKAWGYDPAVRFDLDSPSPLRTAMDVLHKALAKVEER